ncbi:hypothetical protein [Nitrosomonas sp.]
MALSNLVLDVDVIGRAWLGALVLAQTFAATHNQDPATLARAAGG